MEVEHIAGVSLAAGGALQQQRQRPVGDGVLAQVVVHDEHVVPLVHEVLGQGAPGVGGDILQGGGRPRGGGDDGGVFHSPPAGQIFRQLGHRAGLLADGYIDAHHVLALLV